MDLQKIAQDNLIFKCIVGSVLYGTEQQDSDLDYYGIFVPPKEFILGLKKCEQVQSQWEELIHANVRAPIPKGTVGITDPLIKITKRKNEQTIYALDKAIKLMIENNPNMISILYVPDNRVTYNTVWGRRLIDNRHLFLSKLAYHRFSGYAASQRIKMSNRNPVGNRAIEYEKFGWSVKFGMHLIRLLYECLDILTIGELVYPSRQNQILLSIRRGEKSLEWVTDESKRLTDLIDQAYVKSDLQKHPQRDKIEQLQMEIFEDYWATQIL